MKRIKKDSSALKVFWCVLLGCSLFVLCFSLLEKAKADEYLYTGAWSYHVGDPKRHLKNETHYLLGYTKNDSILAVFKNSYSDPAVLIGRNLKDWDVGEFNVRLYGGVVLGYWTCFGGREEGDKHTNICPIIIPELSYTKYKIQPTVLALGNAVAFTFKWEIEI